MNQLDYPSIYGKMQVSVHQPFFMIAYLQGTILKRLDKQIIVNVQGVGYLVWLGNDLMSKFEEQQDIALFISTQVKEDDIALYGFLDEAHWKFFQQLISVSGIGAKTAMGILDMPLELTLRAIQEGDTTYLSKAPGLGKKTAARLVLELKEKIDVSLDTLEPSSDTPRSLQEEALDALMSLGYDKPSIIRFLNSSDQSYDSAEELVTSFLQNA